MISFYVSLFQCLKFKTDQAQDAKKMEKLNNIFFALMARGPDGKLPSLNYLSKFRLHCNIPWKKSFSVGS